MKELAEKIAVICESSAVPPTRILGKDAPADWDMRTDTAEILLAEAERQGIDRDELLKQADAKYIANALYD